MPFHGHQCEMLIKDLASIAPPNEVSRTLNHPGGRPPLYSNPNDLLKSVFDYFEWVSHNPLYDYKLSTKGALMEVPKKRYPTTSACARFCGVAPRTWRSWKSKNHRLCEVVEFAESVILQIKMEGVVAGLFRPNIMARDLGLDESQALEANMSVNLVNRGEYTKNPKLV